MTALVPLALAWVLSGAAFAAIMHRRGHHGRAWPAVCTLAGPFAALLVADRARFIEPAAAPTVMARTTGQRRGVTVVVPVGAVGAIDARTLDRLGLAPGAVDVAFPVPYDLPHPGVVQAVPTGTDPAIAEAVHRLGQHPLQVVTLPGHPADAIARWAADRAPAVIVTTPRAQPPRSLGRLARLAAERPGISLMVVDPTALAPSATAHAHDT